MGRIEEIDAEIEVILHEWKAASRVWHETEREFGARKGALDIERERLSYQ